MQEYSKCKRPASQHPPSRNTVSTQCPSLHLGCCNSCLTSRKRFKYDGSCLQPFELPCQCCDNQCCVAGQRCQSCLKPRPCNYDASTGNQSTHSIKQPCRCASCTLVAAVDGGIPGEARKQASRKRKKRKKRRRKTRKSGKNSLKCEIMEFSLPFVGKSHILNI